MAKLFLITPGALLGNVTFNGTKSNVAITEADTLIKHTHVGRPHSAIPQVVAGLGRMSFLATSPKE